MEALQEVTTSVHRLERHVPIDFRWLIVLISLSPGLKKRWLNAMVRLLVGVPVQPAQLNLLVSSNY